MTSGAQDNYGVGTRRGLLAWAWVALIVFARHTGPAYERYKNPSTGAGQCAECHGSFNDGTSPKGTVFPANDKHEMHRSGSFMNTACALCHLATDAWNPYIGVSTGTTNNPGLGCSGCHAQAGLVAHHAIHSVTDCLECHDLTAAPPENVTPRYYGTPDTRAANPCNGAALGMTNENWSLGDFVGLDNDGNNLYDAADPACGDAGLTVSPGSGLGSSGEVGGPFAPSSILYTLSNTGASPLDWTASKGQDWVSLSATGGTLAAGAVTNVMVSLNPNAQALSAGVYRDEVGFADTTAGSGNTTREISLTVIEVFTTNHPTPLWWLRAQGVTNDFETAVAAVGANGCPLWQSYVAGLDPRNPASQFRLGGILAADGGSFVLTWSPVTDRFYTVWSSTNLANGFSPIPDASNLTWTVHGFTNRVAPSAPRRFYRLEVRKP